MVLVVLVVLVGMSLETLTRLAGGESVPLLVLTIWSVFMFHLSGKLLIECVFVDRGKEKQNIEKELLALCAGHLPAIFGKGAAK